MIQRTLNDKEKRRKIEFVMSVIRTMAAVLAAAFLILTHWK